jgi:bifunctional non-homologous end joining protein LigD
VALHRGLGLSLSLTFFALRRGIEAVLYAFDLLEHDGNDLRRLPLIERKWRRFKLIGKAQRRAIRYKEHLTGDGPTVQVCLPHGP